jgi:hypothetical protein
VWVRGRTDRRTNGVQIVAEEFLSLEEAERSVELHISIDAEAVTEAFAHKLKEIFEASPGVSPVYVHLTGDEPVTVRLGVHVGLTKALLAQLEALLGGREKIQRVTRRGGR